MTPGHVRDDGFDLVGVQSGQLNRSDLKPRPTNEELGATRDAEERSATGAVLNDQVEKVECRRVGPVDVFDQESQREPLRRPGHPLAQDFQGSDAPSHRRQVMNRRLVGTGDRKQRRHQGKRVHPKARVLAQQAGQRFELGGRRLAAGVLRHPRIEHLDEGSKGGGLGEG